MNSGYREIRIVWNPNFQYGGPVSVEVYAESDSGLELVDLFNGFYNRSGAWWFAHELVKGLDRYLIVDNTIDNPYVAD